MPLRMKKTLRIIFILMLMIVTALTFVYVGMIRGNDTDSENGGVSSDLQLDSRELASGNRKLGIDGGSIVLETGQSHQCSAHFDDGRTVSGVNWSCSDETVAKVDGKGRVSAISPGSAELWAVLGKDSKARAIVTVYENIEDAAYKAVVALAADGSDTSMNNVMMMTQGLAGSNDKQTVKTAAVMKALAEFRTLGKEDGDSAPLQWEKLVSAVEKSELPIDEGTLRQAALAAYCHGEKDASDFTLSFTGDCTFAYFNGEDGKNKFPTVYRNSGSVSYPFDLTRCVFGADDLTMINLEGALTDSLTHKQKQFYFRGEPSYVKILTSSSVEAVTLENNHSFDYYDTGFYDTVDILTNAGVNYTSYYLPAAIDINGCRVVMLSMCLIGTEYNDEFREHVEEYVNRFRARDTLIVMNVHWGEEKSSRPAKYQIEAAHAMIDCGVDLVIGHHPHVLQGIEEYEGHYIAYSLGNFSFGGNTSALRPYTVILRASFKKSDSGSPKISRFSIVPCLTTSSGSTVNNYQPTPVYGAKGDEVTDYLLSVSSGLDGGITTVSRSMIP